MGELESFHRGVTWGHADAVLGGPGQGDKRKHGLERFQGGRIMRT